MIRETFIIKKLDMSFCSKQLIIVLLLLMASIETISSNNIMILRSESPKSVQVKRSYANLLNSLIEVNQERVTALKKLYVLNSVTYGKDSLRNNIENELDDYDEIQGRLIRALKHILDNLKQTPKATIDEKDLNVVLQNNDHIFVNPIYEEQERDEINNRRERKKVKNALRNEDSDNDSNSNEKLSDKSDSKDDSKSSSLEKQNEESLKEVKRNGTQSRSYYYYEYGCGRGRVRCIRACKEAYRYACDYYYCRSSLRSELRSACKSECRSWFY